MPPRVGKPAPDFTLKDHTSKEIRLRDYRGKNVVLAFFPLAWTPVWTAQIPSYQALRDRFEGMQTQVLGLSVDSIPCLTAWAESLGGITYPLLSDFYPHGAVAKKYGVLRKDGRSERAIFLIDKRGIIRYIDIHDIEKQPDNDELMRILGEVDPEAGDWAAQHPLASSPIPEADVVMYCTSWCPGCRRARLYFAQNGIEFVEIDITRDREAAARVRGWANGNETTPTFNIKGQVIVDFNTAKLDAALGIKR